MEECPKCHADHKFELPITYEFFRTRFEDWRRTKITIPYD
jgi:hypothetical protein